MSQTAVDLLAQKRTLSGKDDTAGRALLTLTFEKGIDESQEESVLSNGFATVLENWVPEPTGVLRARPGWISMGNTHTTGGDTDGDGVQAIAPTTRKVRAVAWMPTTGGGVLRNWWMIGITNDLGITGDNSHKAQIWALLEDFTTPWRFIEDFGPSVDFETYPPDFAKGTGAVLFCQPQMNNFRSWSGDPASPAGSVTHDDPGRAIVFHKSYFFMGGGLTHPSRLYRSAQNNGASWNTADPGGDWVDVGKDDSQPIEDLAEFQGDLIIAKGTKVYIWSNADAATPSTSSTIIELQGAYGSKGRCLVVTPYGLVILGDEEIFLWKGGTPKLISPAVWTDYILGTGGNRCAAYAGGWLYIGSQTTGARDLAFDLINGVWYVLTQGSENEKASCYGAKNNRMAGGVFASTDNGVGPLYYMDLPNGARSPDCGSIQSVFNVSTPRIYPGGAQRLYALRQVSLRYKQRGTGTNHLFVTTYCDGVAHPHVIDIAPKGSAGDYVTGPIDVVNDDAASLQFKVTTTVNGGVLYDVNGVEAEVDLLSARG